MVQEKRLADVTSQLMIREDLARRVIHPSYAAHLNMVPHQDQQFGGSPGPGPDAPIISYPTPGPQPHIAPPLPSFSQQGAVPFTLVIQGTEGRSKDTAIAIDDEDDTAEENGNAITDIAGSSNGPASRTNAAAAPNGLNGESTSMQVDQVQTNPSAPAVHPVVTTYAAILAQSQSRLPSPALASAAPPAPFQPAPAPSAIPTPSDSPALASAIIQTQSQLANGTTGTSIVPPAPTPASTLSSASTATEATEATEATRATCPICGPRQPHAVQDCSLYRAGPEKLQE